MSTSTTKPTLKELTKLAHALAFNVARQQADVDDLVQEGLWSARRMLLRIRHPNKPYALCRTIMQRAMITYYAGGWRGTGVRYRQDFPLTAAPPNRTMLDTQDRLDNKIDMEGYFSGLQAEYGLLARIIAENLITPKEPVYIQQLREAAEHKAKVLRRCSGVVQNVKRLRPSHKQLRMALDLERPAWQEVLKHIRHYTARWLAQQTEPSNLSPQVQRYLHTPQLQTITTTSVRGGPVG
jgi:hypothetical protein